MKQSFTARCLLYGLLVAIGGALSGCGEQQNAASAGPPITEATREAVRTTGTVLPPPATPDSGPKTPFNAPKGILPPPATPEPPPQHP